MKVIICGDRHWVNKDRIREVMLKLPKDAVIIHGAARGADKLAGEVASELGLVVKEYPAKWTQFGRSAGPKRNAEMLKEEPDAVIAFHDDFFGSKGTLNMIKQTAEKNYREKKKIETTIVTTDSYLREMKDPVLIKRINGALNEFIKTGDLNELRSKILGKQ